MSFKVSSYPFDRVVPLHYECSITLDIMNNPIRLDCEGAHVCDQSSFEAWEKKNPENPTCPMDRAPIKNAAPDKKLKAEIEDWKNKHWIEEITPEDLANYFFSPDTLPFSTSRDQLQSLSAYLRFIKAANITDEVAPHIVRLANEHSIELPSCKKSHCPKIFDALDDETYAIFSEIVSQAHEIKDPDMLEERRQAQLHQDQAKTNVEERLTKMEETMAGQADKTARKKLKRQKEKKEEAERIKAEQEEKKSRTKIATGVGVAVGLFALCNPVTTTATTGWFLWQSTVTSISWGSTLFSTATAGLAAMKVTEFAKDTTSSFSKPS